MKEARQLQVEQFSQKGSLGTKPNLAQKDKATPSISVDDAELKVDDVAEEYGVKRKKKSYVEPSSIESPQKARPKTQEGKGKRQSIKKI